MSKQSEPQTTAWQPIETCPEGRQILFLAGDSFGDADTWFGIKDKERFFGVDLISGDLEGKFDDLSEDGEPDYNRFMGVIILMHLEVFKWMELPA